jgi:tetratricopeptide (TPR) repeat protein
MEASDDWRGALRRGRDRLRHGDFEDAREHFARAHALAPDEPTPMLALGREEWRRGRLAEAERLLRQAHRQVPDSPLAVAALARVLVERGVRGEAEALIAAALAIHPRSPALLAVSGEVHLAVERFEEASEAFEAAREAGAPGRLCDAGLARAENQHALALEGAGHDTEAAFSWKRACDLDPLWSTPRVNLGALFHRLGRKSAARAQYRRAIALDPSNALGHFNLALLEREEGNLVAAEDCFLQALRAEPPHPDARRELALTCADRGDYARAAELFEEELRVTRRRDATVFVNLGVAYARMGEPGKAEAALREALRIDGRHVAALGNLARILADRGATREAAALADRAREVRNSAAPPVSK